MDSRELTVAEWYCDQVKSRPKKIKRKISGYKVVSDQRHYRYDLLRVISGLV